ncbi:MAG TPA: histidine kinase [Chitinophagaceae bacterium]|nr:histidine kinase [Chitinophagaceae bacterium]
MKFRVRYRFWNVFLTVLAVVILIACFAFLSYALFPNEQAMHELNKVPGRTYLLRYGMGFIFIVIFLYFTTNYFYWLIVDRKKFISYLKVVFIIILGSFVYHAILFYFLPEALRQPYPTLLFMFFAMVINLVLYFGISLLVAYITTLREGQKQRKILEAQKLQLEVEKSEANLNFLKAQINPHFLHNTLNFLYAKSIPYSPELSEGILTLSDIMRYALSEGNARDGKAPLKDEIEHVRNVIKINQLRFGNNLNVNFEVSGVVNGAMIIPFVLITLVENAFKHGDLKKQEYPIDIKLNINGNKLYFFCRNKKKSGPKELSTGIGLENIRKRLDLAYGDKYKFAAKDETEFYTIELTIDQL